jgi:signal recognition particle GTPase
MLGRFFGKIKKGLAKTRNVFSGVVGLFTGSHRVDKAFLDKLEEQLVLADVGVKASARRTRTRKSATTSRRSCGCNCANTSPIPRKV